MLFVPGFVRIMQIINRASCLIECTVKPAGRKTQDYALNTGRYRKAGDLFSLRAGSLAGCEAAWAINFGLTRQMAFCVGRG